MRDLPVRPRPMGHRHRFAWAPAWAPRSVLEVEISSFPFCQTPLGSPGRRVASRCHRMPPSTAGVATRSDSVPLLEWRAPAATIGAHEAHS
jgi:hypothetical protein